MNYMILQIEKVFGKFKIETLPHLEIDEFCCLRSKSYSYTFNNKLR